MTAYEVDKARWAFKLAPQLTGRAQQAYAALDPSNAECYATVKAAILRRNNINDETYRQRFRSYKYKVGQTPTEIATRLTDLAGRWLKDSSTMEEVKDAVVKEQLLAVLPEDIRMWVKERKRRPRRYSWQRITYKPGKQVPLNPTGCPQVHALVAENMVIGRVIAPIIPSRRTRSRPRRKDHDSRSLGTRSTRGMAAANAVDLRTRDHAPRTASSATTAMRGAISHTTAPKRHYLVPSPRQYVSRSGPTTRGRSTEYIAGTLW